MKIAMLLILFGCSTPPPDFTHIRVAGLGFDARLDGWQHKEAKEIGRIASRWTPTENTNKESISIIRVAVPQQLRTATPAQLIEVLKLAQGVLPEPALRQPTTQLTKQKLREIEIVSDFIPSGLNSSYHRAHAVLVDGDTLIHVLYTARNPDPDLMVFHQIVASIRREEGQS